LSLLALGLLFVSIVFSIYLSNFVFLQIDYCKEHNVFWRCKGYGYDVEKQPRDLSQPEKQFWKAEPRPGDSSHHSRFFFQFVLLGCRCNSETKNVFLTARKEYVEHTSAKIVTRFFACLAAHKLAARLRAKNRLRAFVLRFTMQQRICRILVLEKYKADFFKF
jgi:hypothetical protein